MRPRPPFAPFVVAALAAAVASACTDGREEAGPVTRVATDVPFSDAVPTLQDWSEPLFDVYAPAGAHDLPLVVLFPEHSILKDGLDNPALARAIADRGAVVMVPNWTQTSEPADADGTVAVVAAARSVAACAVTFAAAHAGEYGASADRLVLAGHLYGANIAAMTALLPVAPISGCAAGPAGPPTVDGLLAVDGDWMVAMNRWDAFHGGAAQVLEELSPIGRLDEAVTVRTELVISTALGPVTERCDDTDDLFPAWLRDRDTDFSMSEDLLADGALANQCVTGGEATRVLALRMQERGMPAHLAVIEGTAEARFTTADLDALAAMAIALTGDASA